MTYSTPNPFLFCSSTRAYEHEEPNEPCPEPRQPLTPSMHRTKPNKYDEQPHLRDDGQLGNDEQTR